MTESQQKVQSQAQADYSPQHIARNQDKPIEDLVKDLLANKSKEIG
jgi:hypothetical protein